MSDQAEADSLALDIVRQQLLRSKESGDTLQSMDRAMTEMRYATGGNGFGTHSTRIAYDSERAERLKTELRSRAEAFLAEFKNAASACLLAAEELDEALNPGPEDARKVLLTANQRELIRKALKKVYEYADADAEIMASITEPYPACMMPDVQVAADTLAAVEEIRKLIGD